MHTYLLYVNKKSYKQIRKAICKQEKAERKKERQFPFRKLPFLFGAGGRGRTGTVSLPLDFESSTSANSITPAGGFLTLVYYNGFFSKNQQEISFSPKNFLSVKKQRKIRGITDIQNGRQAAFMKIISLN